MVYPQTHHGDEAAGADRVVDAGPLVEVRIIPPPQVVLVSSVVWFLIDHEAAALHFDRAAAAEETQQVGTVAAALKMASREVLVLVEDDLEMEIQTFYFLRIKLNKIIQR